MVLSKKELGQFYTKGNPFSHSRFLSWYYEHGLQNDKILEPFSGDCDLLKSLQALNLLNSFQAYDIDPHVEGVIKQDTLKDFPCSFRTCISNPPWLARNSASRQKLFYPDTVYSDIYLFALSLALESCDYVAFLLPESFIHTGLFRERCCVIISQSSSLFLETKHPTCLALFQKDPVLRTEIFFGEDFLGYLQDFESVYSKSKDLFSLTFNVPDGLLSFYGCDGIHGPSIHVSYGEEIPSHFIKVSSRALTRFNVKGIDNENRDVFLKLLNAEILEMRVKTHDVLLTSFKGLRKDGFYRRRLDYTLLRILIGRVLKRMNIL